MVHISSRALRAAAILGIGAVSVGALAGCSTTGGGSSDGPLILQTSAEAGSPRALVLDELAAAFTAESGIELEVQSVNNDDMISSFETASLAGEEADIVMHNLVPDNQDWFTDGLTVDAGPLIEEWGLGDTFQPAAIEYWTQNGGVNGLPFSAFNWPIWYNMDLFNEAGIDAPPATFDELLEDAATLRAAGIQPFVVGGNDWPMQNFTTWVGQQFLTPDAAKDVFANGGWCSNPDAVAGLDLLAQMRDGGVFVDNVEGYTADQMTTAYFNGEAAMMPSGSWGYASAPAEIAAATVLGGFPLPDGGEYALPTAYNGYNTGMFISNNGADRIDDVKAWVEFFYQPENLQKFVVTAGDILAVNAEALGEVPETEFPLVGAGNLLDESVVNYLVLPDGYWPSGYDGIAAGAAFLGSDQSGSEYCQSLDDIYASLG